VRYGIWVVMGAMLHLMAQESFITQYEYGKMLYQNPRGIGCVHCHGKQGRGAVIAQYTHQKKRHILSAPRIDNLHYRVFQKAFKAERDSHSVMPMYHLTDMEIQALYRFLTQKQSPKKPARTVP
jgi:cytochrome c553